MMPGLERRETDAKSLGRFSAWNALDVHEINDRPGCRGQVFQRPRKDPRSFSGNIFLFRVWSVIDEQSCNAHTILAGGFLID